MPYFDLVFIGWLLAGLGGESEGEAKVEWIDFELEAEPGSKWGSEFVRDGWVDLGLIGQLEGGEVGSECVRSNWEKGLDGEATWLAMVAKVRTTIWDGIIGKLIGIDGTISWVDEEWLEKA